MTLASLANLDWATFQGTYLKKLDGRKHQTDLQVAVIALTASWQTPTVVDATGRDYVYPSGDHDRPFLTLPRQAQLAGWATPVVADADGIRYETRKGKKRSNPGYTLTDQLHDLPASGTATPSSPAPTARRGVLNPAFSLWLMGFPSSWLMAAPAKASAVPRPSGASGTPSSPPSPPCSSAPSSRPNTISTITEETMMTTQPPPPPDARTLRRRELQAALAALDEHDAAAAHRRALAQAVLDANCAATARNLVVALATAIDREEAAEKLTGNPVSSPAEGPKAAVPMTLTLSVGVPRAAGPADSPGWSAPEPSGQGEHPPEPLAGLSVSPDAVRKAYCADKLAAAAQTGKKPAAVTPVMVEGVPYVCTGYGGPDHDGSCFAWLVPLSSKAVWDEVLYAPPASNLPQPGETNETAYAGRLVTWRKKQYVMQGRRRQRTVTWTEAKKEADPWKTEPVKAASCCWDLLLFEDASGFLVQSTAEQLDALAAIKARAMKAKSQAEFDAIVPEVRALFPTPPADAIDEPAREREDEARAAAVARADEWCYAPGPDGTRCDSPRGHAGGHTWREVSAAEEGEEGAQRGLFPGIEPVTPTAQTEGA